MLLSLCMIVKDEAQTLPRCLASVQGVVDEIVILDTGSEDQTVAIAKSLGARVYQQPWENDFAAARNQSLAQVQGDWVLVLDADETLLPGVVPVLRQVIQQPQVLVVNLLRREEGAAQVPYSLLSRLFRRHPQIYFSRPFHELIDDSVEALRGVEPGWQILDLPGVAIAHDGYRADKIAQRRKLERAETMMSQYLAAHSEDAYVCSKLGGLYLQTGRLVQALTLLQQGLQMPDIPPATRYELHYHLALAYTQASQVELALSHYQQASREPIPEHLKLATYNNWGSLLKDLEALPQARTLFTRVVSLVPEFAAGHYNLGATLRAMGDLEGAIAAYQQALKLQPDYAEVYQNLGVALLQRGQVSESLAAFQQAIQLLASSQPQEAEALRQGLAEIGFEV